MILATAAQMREIDRIAMHELGVPGEDLMERAGSEVAAALKADAVTRDVPIIFLTALVSEADAKADGACSSGGNTFLPKHIRLDRLMHCIDEKIQKHQAVPAGAH